MQDERLRLLALWHALRRDVDGLLEPLLSHGPVAVTRVTAHLPEIELAVRHERAGFEAFVAACDDTVDLPRDELARGRALAATPEGGAHDLDQEATVIHLPERTPQR